MTNDQIQLPAGYEDAKPVQAQPKPAQMKLPAGYEDAKPVQAAKPSQPTQVKPPAGYEGATPAGPRPTMVPPAVKPPTTEMNYVSPISGAEHKPSPKEFSERPIGETGLAENLIDTAKGVGSHVYHSFADEPTAEERKNDLEATLQGQSTPNRIERGVKRMTGVDESTIPRYERGLIRGGTNLLGAGAGAIKDIGSYAFGSRPLIISDEKNGESLAHKYLIAPAEAEHKKAVTAPTALESLGHSVAEAIPFFGPIAANLGETAGTGDVAGAAGEASTYSLAPKVMEEAPKVVKGLPIIRDVVKAVSDAAKERKARAVETATENASADLIKVLKPREILPGKPSIINPEEEGGAYDQALERGRRDIKNTVEHPYSYPLGKAIARQGGPSVVAGLSKIADFLEKPANALAAMEPTPLIAPRSQKPAAEAEPFVHEGWKRKPAPIVYETAEESAKAKTAPEGRAESGTSPPSDELIPTKPATPPAEARGNISGDLRDTLKKNGYSDTQIKRMRPEDAQAHAEVTPKQRVAATIAQPVVREQVSHLSDANLRKAAKSVGIDSTEYDFNARDAGRHRIERGQLAKDITEQLHPEEALLHAEKAKEFEHNADQSQTAKAQRAAELFKHRLGNAPLDPYGNPRIGGGSRKC